MDQRPKDGNPQPDVGSSPKPSTDPLPPKWPLRTKLGEKVIKSESREGQRTAPPSEQQAANKGRPECRRTAGSRPPEGSSLVSQARRAPNRADKGLRFQAELQPWQEQLELKREGRICPDCEDQRWEQEPLASEGHGDGRKATLRSRVWLQGQQKGEGDGAKRRTERPQFLQSTSSHHLLQPWHHALALSAGSMVALVPCQRAGL